MAAAGCGAGRAGVRGRRRKGSAILRAGGGLGRQARRRARARVRRARRGAAAFDVDGWARRFFAGVAMALDAQAAEEATEARMHVILGSAAAAAAASVGSPPDARWGAASDVGSEAGGGEE